jgi:hypothetical protein
MALTGSTSWPARFPLLPFFLVSCFAGLATLILFPPTTQAGSRIVAPELVGGVDYLGSKDPIRLKDLRGKIVVLDFWTLC